MLRLTIGGQCRRGHVIEGDNLGWRNGKKAGTKRLVCVACEAIRKSAYRKEIKSDPVRRIYALETKRVAQKRARLLERIVAAESMEDTIALKDDTKPTSPWVYLSPTGTALEALDRLNKELDKSRTPCFNDPEPYQDYSDENPPTAVEAAMLCKDCPLATLRACREYGRVSGDRGVWGGKVNLLAVKPKSRTRNKED